MDAQEFTDVIQVCTDGSSLSEEVAAAEPVYLDMLCNYEEVDDGKGGVTGKGYRYLFFVVEDTYNGSTGNYGYEVNENEYVTFSELEVCVQAK